LKKLKPVDQTLQKFSYANIAYAYQRLRYCSHARAIENECLVAITGSVGNLPYAENMDIQYAQAAIFSPSDFVMVN
jgi:hypothetical protein